MRQLRLQGEATPFGSQSELVIEPDHGILLFSLPFYLLLLDLAVLRRHWVTPLGCPGVTPPPCAVLPLELTRMFSVLIFPSTFHLSCRFHKQHFVKYQVSQS